MDYETITCKYCGGTTPKAGIYCMVCGERLARKKRDKTRAVKVPKPQQRADGSWWARLMVDGERFTVEGETEAEYYDKAKAIKAGVLEVKKRGPKMTLGEALDAYIEDRSRVLSPATIRGYKEIRAQRFEEVMGRSLDEEINWQAVINDEAGKGKSAKTIRNAWGLVRSALAAQGVSVPPVRLPQRQKEERPWLDYEQIRVFLDKMHGRPGEMAALLALHSLRRSELLALTKADVDLKAKEIHVAGAMVRGPDGMVTKTQTKTQAGRRSVPIMIDRLEELINAAGEGPLVTGNPNTSRKQINAACKSAGLPLPGNHGLRHSFCALAFHLGWDESAVMQVGGWDDPGVVHGIYKHLAAKDKAKNVDAMKHFYQTITKSK